MKPTTTKALSGMAAVTVVAVAYFVFGCEEGQLIPLVGAILILAGKEGLELIRVANGGGE